MILKAAFSLRRSVSWWPSPEEPLAQLELLFDIADFFPVFLVQLLRGIP
jgi:hypothetical protein